MVTRFSWMKSALIALLAGASPVFFPDVGFAHDSGGKKQGKSKHGAHEHGKATLDIAVEGPLLTLILHAPADSIYGFEREARTEKEKKSVDSAVGQLKEQALAYFKLDDRLGCQLDSAKVEPFVVTSGATKESEKGKKKSGEHGEVQAEWALKCKEPLAGKSLTISLGKAFTGIKTLEARVVSENTQWGGTVDPKAGTVQL